jgi:hypothetical protein
MTGRSIPVILSPMSTYPASSRRPAHQIFAEHVAPRPPPAKPVDRVVYGLVQPLLGLRLLVTDRELLRAALVPVGLLAAFCAAVALLGGGLHGGALHRFYTTFALLAPLPSVLLGHHYARLAVLARHKLGFAPAEPCLESLWRMFKRAVKQAVLIALALAPVSFLLKLIPGAGWALVQAAAAVWALHWVVVDAFDSARYLRPGQTVADLDAAAAALPAPWYVRWLDRAADKLPIGNRLLRRFARLCDRLSVPWREEILLVEKHPTLMLGFALSTAALLALPILNLAFRPVVIIGAAHVLGQLERTEPHLSAE